MNTELKIESMPIERGRIAATLKAETSAETVAVAEASAEVMCRFVGTAIAPYFIVPDTEHMQQAIDVAQVHLPELRINLNRFLTARDPVDAADALAYLLDTLSFADSAQALVIRPYDWVMMNMLKHAENLQDSIAGLYKDFAPKQRGVILGQAAFDLSTSLTGMTDEEYYSLPTSPQVSDLLGRQRRAGAKLKEIEPTHAVVLSVHEDSAIVLVPRKAGGAYILEVETNEAIKDARATANAKKKKKGKDQEQDDDLGTGVPAKSLKLKVKRTLRFALFYRSGSAHYVSPLKELLLIRVLMHMQKLFKGERPFTSNYNYHEAPEEMMKKILSIFLRIASDSLITATGDLSDYLGSEDGRVLLEGVNLTQGYDSMPLFLALLATSPSVKTLEQMLLLSQQGKGAVTSKYDETTPPIALDARFVRWVAEDLLNPVLEYRNRVLKSKGIDVEQFVKDPTFVTGGPDIGAITDDGPTAVKADAPIIFGLDRLQLASVTELIRLEIADLVSGEEMLEKCMKGGYSRVPHYRYNGRYRDQDHLLRLINMHRTMLMHLVPNADDVRSAATLPYRQISFYGPYSSYEFGRTVLPVQYGIYDLAKRVSTQLGSFANVTDADAHAVDVFKYIESSIFRYEPRYMFPFYCLVKDPSKKSATIKEITLESHAGQVYAVTEGADADQELTPLPGAYRATSFWANTAPFNQQYREVGLVSPCWDVSTFELMANLVDLPTDRTYFPSVKPDSVGGRIYLEVDQAKLDDSIKKMLELEFSAAPAGVKRDVCIDKLPALSGIGAIMPYVSRLAHDLKASWMDDFAMIDVDGGIYGVAGTIVIPRDGGYAIRVAGLDPDDRWRAPSLETGFSYKSRSAPYGSVPLTFDAE